MPQEAQATGKIRPFNIIERSLLGNTQANTYPWGTIILNKEQIEKDKANLDDVLVHELTHIGQNQREGGALGSIWNNFRQRNAGYSNKNYEMEAYDAENNRYKKVRTRDIPLKGQ